MANPPKLSPDGAPADPATGQPVNNPPGARIKSTLSAEEVNALSPAAESPAELSRANIDIPPRFSNGIGVTLVDVTPPDLTQDDVKLLALCVEARRRQLIARVGELNVERVHPTSPLNPRPSDMISRDIENVQAELDLVSGLAERLGVVVDQLT